MKLIDIKKLNEVRAKSFYTLDEIRECVTVTSYSEYKLLGGVRNSYQMYFKILSRARHYEGEYISLIDKACSNIPVNRDEISLYKIRAQALYVLLELWFNEKAKVVDYATFDFQEFESWV